MEVANQNIKIETSELLKEFKQHLGIEYNKRILFSGPFGTGKSTFLKEFSEKENDDFFYVKIFPVNYSVSNNEDVFELIKFDLLLQLMGNYYEKIKLEKEDFTLLLKTQVFMMERMKFMPLLYAMLGFSEKLGTPLTKFIEAVESTYGSYNKFSEEINIDEEKEIHTFLKSIEQKKGSSYEMDAVSELIFNLIERIKAGEDNVQSVLIIDDLDRLDPEHIFRLFNIFSAHYDNDYEKNKFGFDKVIFVCDIENIRKIFHHKYGTGVDFSGYIDKFYSLAPFDFNIRKFIQIKIDNFISEIKYEKELTPYGITINDISYVVLKCIINSLIESKQVNLRMLLNIPVITIENMWFENNNGRKQFTTHNTPLIVIFHILKQFYGSFEILEEKLNSMYLDLNPEKYSLNSNMRFDNSLYISTISACLPFVLDIGQKVYPSTPSNESQKYQCFIHHEIPHDNSDYNTIKFQKATKGYEYNSESIILNPYELLIDAFRVCKKRGLLK